MDLAINVGTTGEKSKERVAQSQRPAMRPWEPAAPREAEAFRWSDAWRDAWHGRCVAARSRTAQRASLARRRCFASRPRGRLSRFPLAGWLLDNEPDRYLLRPRPPARGGSLRFRARIRARARSLRVTGPRGTAPASRPANRPVSVAPSLEPSVPRI